VLNYSVKLRAFADRAFAELVRRVETAQHGRRLSKADAQLTVQKSGDARTGNISLEMAYHRSGLALLQAATEFVP
jgi:hypothetical protein